MIEQWRNIPGYEGRYQVSDAGRVRSLSYQVRTVDKVGVERTRRISGRTLRPGSCRGYLVVNLSGSGTIGLHILVARVFCHGETPDREVNHMDGNKHNCAAGNLEWVTKKRNMDHAVDIGLNSQALQVKDPSTGQTYPSISRAARESGASYHTVRTTWSRA